MEINEFEDGLFSGKMSRRKLGKALAAVGIGTAMFPLFHKNANAASEDHPVVFTWEGYNDPGLHGSYLTKYGEGPNFTFFGDEEEAFTKIRAGFKPDMAQPCSYKIPAWRDAGILMPLDTSALTHWDDLVPSLKDIPGMVQNGQRHWVCSDWGQTSILYREDLVELEEESWGLLWDERYAGRLALYDSLIDGVMVAAIYGGAKDPFNMTEEEVAMTESLLREQLPLLLYYANSATEIQQGIASGELVAATATNDSYTFLRSEGLPVKWMSPKEGAMTWTCGMSIMSTATKLDRCYEYLNAMLSPEAGAYEIVEFGFGHANLKAYDLVSEQDLLDRGLTRNPDDLLSAGVFQEPIGNEPELQEMFEQVKAGL
jgi:spermidine/putrescine transport system substrate-binding protein